MLIIRILLSSVPCFRSISSEFIPKIWLNNSYSRKHTITFFMECSC